MLIGITGGIGSGKSEVTKYLRSLGETVICADEVARQVVMPGEPGAEAVRNAFGTIFFDKEGRLNRQAFASLVFSDTAKMAKLNDVLHPIIVKRIDELASECTGRVFIDAALLIQAGMHEGVDYVWLITADMTLRIMRVIERDNTDRKSILQRISGQLSDVEMRQFADEVIENNGVIEDLHKRINELLEKKLYEED